METQLSQLFPSTSDEFLPVSPELTDAPRLWDPGHPAATFIPLHYENAYAYPLVVWLHDDGLDEQCLPQVMRHLSVRNYVAVAPRATQRDADSTGYSWMQESESIEAAGEAVFDAIDQVSNRLNIHRQRIVLAGHGTGATMALRLGLMHPQAFAAVVAMGGGLPKGNQPLRSINSARKLPLCVAYGRESERYGTQQAADDLQLLHSAGCSVHFQQYPDDELTDNMFRDLNAWIMGKVCASSVVANR